MQHLRCYTRAIPTSHPRHTITETPPVARELRRLRALTPGVRIDLKELVILGAREKAARLESDAEQTMSPDPTLEEFLALRHGDQIDAEAGLALHERGWSRDL